MPKYSAATLGKMSLAMPVVWNILVRLFGKAVSSKSRGLVVSEQSQPAFVYGGIHLEFCCLITPCLCAFAAAGFQNEWHGLVCSRTSLVFFHFLLSEQIKNKSFTCRNRLLFFTADEEKRFWKEESLCSFPCDDLCDLFFAAVQITS